MAKEDNLKPFSSAQSRDEAVKNGKKGGEKSGESRRRKRALKTSLSYLMKLPISDAHKDVKKGLKDMGVDIEHMDYSTLMAFSIMTECINGNVKAFIAIRDTLGEKPTDKVEVDGVEFKVEVPANIKNLTTEELRSLAGMPSAPSTEEFTDDGGGDI